MSLFQLCFINYLPRPFLKNLFERDRDSEREQKQGGGGEPGFLLSREPDVGLNARTLGS